jgi:hypothetical protein
MARSTKVISFRLDPDVVKLLQSLADRMNMSASEAARTLVVASLVGEDIALNDRIERLEQSIEGIAKRVAISDKRMATSLYHVLEQVGKIPSDRAKKIAQSVLDLGEGAAQ